MMLQSLSIKEVKGSWFKLQTTQMTVKSVLVAGKVPVNV